MCGIAGFTNQLDKENITLSAQESLRLRGPDESFYFTDSNITLINTRLKVRDLNHGSQPFSDSRKKYTLVYNGEIYNTDYLKTKLSQFKISFTSTSDTEILFWSLVHFGTEIIKEIDGMFAFAFYNNEKNQIIIARDRYGVKPLFFKKDDHFSFASDIKTLTLINKEKKINPNGIIDFLSHNYISDKLTIFEDIHVFPQGHYAVYTDQSLTLNEYWDLPKPIKNEVDYEKVDELLSKATERQLVSDRPLGVFLSSGIDSATIAYYAKQRNSELNTYSVGFQNKYFDLSKY